MLRVRVRLFGNRCNISKAKSNAESSAGWEIYDRGLRWAEIGVMDCCLLAC
jgi:hypothetical protein